MRDGERGRQGVDRVEREVFDSWNIEETCKGTEQSKFSTKNEQRFLGIIGEILQSAFL